MFTLAKLAESRDHETGAHLVRLREYAQLLAEELGQRGPYVGTIDDDFLSDLYRSSPLHDIGKVGICDKILLKPGPLTSDEFEIMKRHTVIGANILNDAVMQLQAGGFLAMAAVIARFHHERWDGTGYLGRTGWRGDSLAGPHRRRGRCLRRLDYGATVQGRLAPRAPTGKRLRRNRAAISTRPWWQRSCAALMIFSAFSAQYADRPPIVTGAMAFIEFAPLQTV